MNQLVFTVFDAAAKAYLEPFFAPTIEAALRGFREVCERDGHQFNKFPEDYSLWHIGAFDGTSGEISGNVGVKIGNAVDFAVIAPAAELLREA